MLRHICTVPAFQVSTMYAGIARSLDMPRGPHEEGLSKRAQQVTCLFAQDLDSGPLY